MRSECKISCFPIQRGVLMRKEYFHGGTAECLWQWRKPEECIWIMSINMHYKTKTDSVKMESLKRVYRETSSSNEAHRSSICGSKMSNVVWNIFSDTTLKLCVLFTVYFLYRPPVICNNHFFLFLSSLPCEYNINN